MNNERNGAGAWYCHVFKIAETSLLRVRRTPVHRNISEGGSGAGSPTTNRLAVAESQLGVACVSAI